MLPYETIRKLAEEAIEEMGDVFYDPDEWGDDELFDPDCACGRAEEFWATRKLSRTEDGSMEFAYVCTRCGTQYSPDHVENLGKRRRDGAERVRRYTATERQMNHVRECIERAIHKALRMAGVHS